MDTKKFIIKQISIFSENRPGRLASVAQALGEEKINILAFSIAEASGFVRGRRPCFHGGILRTVGNPRFQQARL